MAFCLCLTSFSQEHDPKRSPLGPQARRAGTGVGADILLGPAPDDRGIRHGSNGVAASPTRSGRVRREPPPRQIPPSIRGWTLDVYKLARRLAKPKFKLKDLYESEAQLQAQHPGNNNVRPKVRQQLQVLRDLGLLDFIAPGEYTLRAQPDVSIHIS